MDLRSFAGDRRYSLAYGDCPWRFEVRNRKTGLGKSPDKHYRTMKTAEIAALPVGDVMNKDALLVLWGYDPKLFDTDIVARAWGFKFVTVLFRWLKTTKNGKLHFSTGYHTRHGGCEEAFLFKRGKGLPVLSHSVRCEFFSPVREHSRKPDEVYLFLRDLYGPQRGLELFGRYRTEGWDTWGDQVTGAVRSLASLKRGL